MSDPRLRPPALAESLLARRLPEPVAEFLLGDLAESFDARARAEGEASARRWYWRQAMRAAFTRWPSAPAVDMSSRGDGAMQTLLTDLRRGTRSLLRTPGFTAVVVLTLALGIGANTAIFSVVNPVLLRPLPYADPDRLVMLWEREKDGATTNVGYATWLDLRRARTVERTAVASYWVPTMTGAIEPERLIGQRVSADFFGVLGARPLLGRAFLASDDAQGAARVAVLGHTLWQRRFGGDPTIVGRSITLDDTPFTVVGVMGPDYENLLNPRAELWSPLRYDTSLPWACRSCRHLRAIARLRVDATVEGATSELGTIFARLMREHPTDYATPGIVVELLRERVVGDVRPALLAVLGAVVFVLLIACANVMNLLLARARQREAEMAIRAALGAGRGRLVRQLVTESVLLALAGGAAALLVGAWGIRALVALAPDRIPRLDAVRLDPAVLLFTVVLSIVTGVLFGLAPALAGTRANLFDAMRPGTRVAGSRRWHAARGGLVVLEVALSLTLLVGSGLLLRSLSRLLAVDPGFDARSLLTMEVQTGGTRYANDTLVHDFFARAREAVARVPGVREAGFTSQIPLGGNLDSWGVHLRDKPLANPAEAPSADRYSVDPGYLRAMGIPVLRGRGFTSADAMGTPSVAIVNRAFAERLYPGEDPIGKELRIGPPDWPWRTIVGVVGDARHAGLDVPQTLQLYLPHAQLTDNMMVLAVRTSVPPASVAAAVRRAIWSVESQAPISNVVAMDRMIVASTGQRRFALVLFGTFAGVAVLLAAAGLYAVLAGAVTERTREIGVRAALGATRRELLALVVGRGMGLATLGVAIGAGASLALARLLGELLFGVAPFDPITFASVAVLLLAVALAACLVPAWRAARVDPVIALRSE
jgi:putative ABC transport system permease protein